MRGVLQLLLWQQQQQGHLISPNNADGATSCLGDLSKRASMIFLTWTWTWTWTWVNLVSAKSHRAVAPCWQSRCTVLAQDSGFLGGGV